MFAVTHSAIAVLAGLLGATLRPQRALPLAVPLSECRCVCEVNHTVHEQVVPQYQQLFLTLVNLLVLALSSVSWCCAARRRVLKPAEAKPVTPVETCSEEVIWLARKQSLQAVARCRSSHGEGSR